MKKRSNRIKVTAFTKDGVRIKSFKSIHEFRKYAGVGRFSPVMLRQISSGKLVHVKGYLLGLKGRFPYKVNPLWCDSIMYRLTATKKKNLLRLRKFNDDHQLIVIVDNTMKILGFTRSSLKDLSKKEGVPSGTIKASLHKSPKGFDGIRGSRYYIRLHDLPSFIENMAKRIANDKNKKS